MADDGTEYPEISPEELAELEDYLSEDEGEDDFEIPVSKDFSTIIVVDGLPVIPTSKSAKLQNVLVRIFGQFGEIDKEQGFFMPFGDNGKSLGCCFVEFASSESAKVAAKSTDNYKLDRRHTFKVKVYSQLQALAKVPDTFPEPTRPVFERDGLYDWLVDSDSRDQLLVRHGQETEIMWGEAAGAPSLEYGGEREKAQGMVWCDMTVHWSPQGTFLTTLHRQGIALWGCTGWKKLLRLKHPGVWKVQFSPCERYLVTWDGRVGNSNDNAVIVWDTRTGKKLRAWAHPGNGEEEEDANRGAMWPLFQWAATGKYLARISPDKQGIHVHETPSMRLLGKRKIQAPGVAGISWAPATPGKPLSDEVPQNLAYWCPERDNRAAQVTLVTVPTRKVMASKNLFLVTGCEFYWQNRGEFLGVVVARHTKTKKPGPTNLEIFRICDRGVPVEMVQVPKRVHCFAFEPNGVRFGVVSGDGPHRLNVAFYSLGKSRGGNQVKTVVTLPDKEVNRLVWSPRGQHVVMAGLDAINGILEFYDVNAKRSMATADHFMCNRILWDPSGRTVITAVVTSLFGGSVRHDLESGYHVHTFQGQLLFRNQVQKLYQLDWRPRPPSLLSQQERQNIVRNLKKYINKYEERDRARAREGRRAERRRRAQLIADFSEHLATAAAAAQEMETEYASRGWEVYAEGEYEIVEDTVEIVLQVDQSVMQPGEAQ